MSLQGHGDRSYTYKSAYLGARKLHAEAQLYDSFVPRENVLLPNVGQTLRDGVGSANTAARVPLLASTRVGRKGKPVDWAAWLGKPLSSGAYGTTFRLRYAPNMATLLDQMKRAAAFLIEHRRPAPGSYVVLKVAADQGESGRPPFHSLGRVDEFARESVMESSWHRALNNGACARLPGLAKGVCPSDNVPDLYWSGMVADALQGRRFYVTLMGLAPGVTLGEFVNGKVVNGRRVAPQPLPASLYLAVERAVAMVWTHGIAHTDFHWDNVLVDPATERVTIIDFGQAVGLSPALVSQVRQTLPRAVEAGVRSLGELWQAAGTSAYGVDIKRYTNQVRAGRYGIRRGQATWYNPDGNSLMQLYRKMSAAQRAAVPSMRRTLWGAPGSREPLRPTQPSARSASSTVTKAAAKAAERSRKASNRARRSLGARGSLKKRIPSSKRAQMLQAAAKLALPGGAQRSGSDKVQGRFRAARLAAANRAARFKAAVATRLPGGTADRAARYRQAVATRLPGGTANRAARFRAAVATRLPSPSPMQISPVVAFGSPMNISPRR